MLAILSEAKVSEDGQMDSYRGYLEGVTIWDQKNVKKEEWRRGGESGGREGIKEGRMQKRDKRMKRE